MPVLTCPFTTIPAFFTAKAAGETVYPGVGTTTQLAITPVAGEVWNVEGLSIIYRIKYLLGYNLVNKSAYEAILKVKAAIVKQETALAVKKTRLEEQLPKIQTATEKAGGESIEGLTLESQKLAVEAEIRGAVEDQEGYVRDKETAEKELAELGVQGTREGVRAPAVTLGLRVYVRGNELIYNTDLSPNRSIVSTGILRAAETTQAKAEIVEAGQDHVQFDDPVALGEHENLTLDFVIVGPPPLSAGEGPTLITEAEKAGAIEVSAIQASVNYSRKTEGGQ